MSPLENPSVVSGHIVWDGTDHYRLGAAVAGGWGHLSIVTGPSHQPHNFPDTGLWVGTYGATVTELRDTV